MLCVAMGEAPAPVPPSVRNTCRESVMRVRASCESIYTAVARDTRLGACRPRSVAMHAHRHPTGIQYELIYMYELTRRASQSSQGVYGMCTAPQSSSRVGESAPSRELRMSLYMVRPEWSLAGSISMAPMAPLEDAASC